MVTIVFTFQRVSLHDIDWEDVIWLRYETSRLSVDLHYFNVQHIPCDDQKSPKSSSLFSLPFSLPFSFSVYDWKTWFREQILFPSSKHLVSKILLYFKSMPGIYFLYLIFSSFILSRSHSPAKCHSHFNLHLKASLLGLNSPSTYYELICWI